MPKFTVPMTILASIDVECADKRTAIHLARSFTEGLSPEQPYIDGYNSGWPELSTVLAMSGFDIEAIDSDEIEEIPEPTVQPVMLAKVEPVGADEAVRAAVAAAIEDGVLGGMGKVADAIFATSEQMPAATGLRTFTIDNWEGESIWTWEGVASSSQEAVVYAVEGLNADWERNYPTWEALRDDMDGTAIIEHPAVMAPRIPAALLETLIGLAEEAMTVREGDDEDETDPEVMASYRADIAAANRVLRGKD